MINFSIIDIATLIGTFLILLIYRRTKEYNSLKGFFLLLIFIVLLIMKFARIRGSESILLVDSTLAISGILVLFVTTTFAFIRYLFKRNDKVVDDSKKYTLILLLLYLLFGFAQQIFFQFIFLESVFNLLPNFWLSVLFTSLFFGFFHFNGKLNKFFAGTFLLNFFLSGIYLSYGDIIWPSLTHAFLAVLYYNWIYEGNVLRDRLSFV